MVILFVINIKLTFKIQKVLPKLAVNGLHKVMYSIFSIVYEVSIFGGLRVRELHLFKPGQL